MAKEGKNNFELKKGNRFQFDLSKNPKRTFDLVKDIDEASITRVPLQTPTDTKTTLTQATTQSRTPIGTVATSKEKEQSNIKNDSSKTDIQGSNQTNDLNKPAESPNAPQMPVSPVFSGTAEETENDGGDSNKWMWIIGAILVVAIIVWLCVRGCSSSNDNGAATEPTVEAVEATETSEEEAVVEEPTTESEAEPPVSSDAETENPTVEEGASASTATPLETQTSATTATPASTPATVISETVSRSAANTVSTAASAPAAELSNDIEAEALKVIRGDYGTGIDRKLKLGSKFREIQDRVNELKRQGAF